MTDCISMEMLRREGLIAALTNDEHFKQEGFVCLLDGEQRGGMRPPHSPRVRSGKPQPRILSRN